LARFAKERKKYGFLRNRYLVAALAGTINVLLL
jgi:hypothetical protein